MKIQMMKWIKDIFFEFRSITGIGIENTLSYFEKINPEFKRIKFKSGTKVFDWKVPKVWEINQAYIEHESGKKYCDIQSSNLHIINYSSKVNKIMTKKKLLDLKTGVVAEIDLSVEEQAEHDARVQAYQDSAFDREILKLRKQRNLLLAETDWWGASDNTMTTEQTQYRQDLRDITNGLTTVEEVNAVEFPTKPS